MTHRLHISRVMVDFDDNFSLIFVDGLLAFLARNCTGAVSYDFNENDIPGDLVFEDETDRLMVAMTYP
jgi:hypothetical protein